MCCILGLKGLIERCSHPISICLFMILFLFCVVFFCELNMAKLWDIAGRLAIYLLFVIVSVNYFILNISDMLLAKQ